MSGKLIRSILFILNWFTITTCFTGLVCEDWGDAYNSYNSAQCLVCSRHSVNYCCGLCPFVGTTEVLSQSFRQSLPWEGTNTRHLLNAKEQLYTAASTTPYKSEMNQCLDGGLSLTHLLHTSKPPTHHNLYIILLRKTSSHPLHMGRAQSDNPSTHHLLSLSSWQFSVGTLQGPTGTPQKLPQPHSVPSTPPLSFRALLKPHLLPRNFTQAPLSLNPKNLS